MRNLHFEELMILSKPEKKARKIKFSPKKNIILGQNDVGKSTLIKALYHSLGADAPQLNNNRWKKANPIYCLKFSIDGITRYVIRDEKYFGLFDANRKLIRKFKGISGEDGFAKGINPLLDFNIELESKDGRLRLAGPAYYFLPFYVDQDEGWNTSWSSFTGLLAIKDYKKNMMDYHLGIRSQRFYDTQSKVHSLDADFAALSRDKDALITVRDGYKSKKAVEKVDLDPAAFKGEIEELVVSYNALYGDQQNILNRIKEARNVRLGLEQEIGVLERAIQELDADYSYLEAPTTLDVVDCPTCGTEFANSVAERFGVLDDIDYCRNLIDQKKKEVIEASEKVVALDAEYREFEKRLSSINVLLQRERNKVTFQEVIRSEGYKDVMQSISVDIHGVDAKQVGIERDLIELKKELKVDADLRKRVVAFYQAKMKDSLNQLNVHVLSENDYKTPEKTIKNNALGSDLPRSLLAQYVSLLHTMKKFNSFTVCPLVIDSPLQQEQDNVNAKAIFAFIFAGCLEDEQLIVGTLPTDDVRALASSDASVSVIELSDQYGLLSAGEYSDVLATVEPMHTITLAVAS